MPYGELRGGSVRTSDAIRAAYPGRSTLAVGDGDYRATGTICSKGRPAAIFTCSAAGSAIRSISL